MKVKFKNLPPVIRRILDSYNNEIQDYTTMEKINQAVRKFGYNVGYDLGSEVSFFMRDRPLQTISFIHEWMHGASYFDLDDECTLDDGSIVLGFTTRENGSVYDETHGKEDYTEALRICKLAKEHMPVLKTEISTTDEWVNIEYTL